MVYHTHHTAIGAPYLHNSGNKALVESMNAPMGEFDPRILARRGVDIVAVCAHPMDSYFVPVRHGQETLYGALAQGRHTSWLEPLRSRVPEPAVRVYRLVPPRQLHPAGQ